MASWELKTGTVSRVAQKGLQIEGDDQWYNANFNPEYFTEISVGDEVVFNFASKSKGGKTFHNITKQPEVKGSNGVSVGNTPTATKPAGRTGEPTLHRERLILNQNALTQAVAYWHIVANGGESPTEEDILETARKFVAWTSGDMGNDGPESAADAIREYDAPSNAAWEAAAKALDDVKVA
jgi:hypothetical protein